MPKQPMGRFSTVFNSIPARIREQATISHYDKEVIADEQVFSYVSPHKETLDSLTVAINSLVGVELELEAIAQDPAGLMLAAKTLRIVDNSPVSTTLGVDVPANAVFVITARFINAGQLTFAPSAKGLAISLVVSNVKRNSEERQEAMAEHMRTRG